MALLDACACEVLRSEGMPDAVVDAIGACHRSPRPQEALATIAASFGFEGFSYLLLARTQPQARPLAHWTTAGPAWIARYAARGYHLVDPRVSLTRNRTVPVAWVADRDAPDAHARAFAQDATHCAIRGGVAWSLHDAQAGRAVIAWDSRREPGADATPLRNCLGKLALVAGFVHEALVGHCSAAPESHRSHPLTDRERQCVSLVARGMTSADVGEKLGISARTANFHIGNVMTKLGAVSRSEAIARAVASRLVTLDA